MKTTTFNGKDIHWHEFGPNCNDWHNYANDWEYSCQRFGKYIKPGDLVVDIGAYCGDYTMPFGLHAGPDGLVIAFEPHHMTFPVLKQNAELNRELCHFECYQVAIMSEPGEYTFHYGDNLWFNGGHAAGLEVPVGKGKIPHTVPTQVKGDRIHGYLPEGRKINFLKVDTEGWDHHVLRSMQDIIARDRPIIMAEVFTDLTIKEREDFMRVVNDIGYTVNGKSPSLEHFVSNVAYDVVLRP